MRPKPADIDSYIAAFPPGTRAVLEQLRAIIHKAVPRAEGTISYAIPAFRLDGRAFLYFAGFKAHVSIYPVPRGDAALVEELEPYQAGKGTLRSALHKRLSVGLITRMVKQRMKEHAERTKARKN